MDEFIKYVSQLALNHLGLTTIVILAILSGLFKLTRHEIDPLGWLIGWIGKKFTKDVREDVAQLKKTTDAKFQEIKEDRSRKIDELKTDYETKIDDLRKTVVATKEETNNKIAELRRDIDAFETRTNDSMEKMSAGTQINCELLKKRMDQIEKSTQLSNDMQTVRQIKAHVLDFANSCMNKRKHTRLDFENIIHENEEYERLVKQYGLVNDVYKEDFEYIMTIYRKCRDERAFLNDSNVD